MEFIKKIKCNFSIKKFIWLAVILVYILIFCLLFYNNLSIKDDIGRLDKILYLIIAMVINLIVLFILFLIYKCKKIKAEVFFVIAASMLGLLFVFATPILKAHDEFYHWYKSYAVSIGHFVPSESSEEGLLYDKLPKIVEDLPNNLGSFWLIDYKKEIKEFINIECKQNEKYGEKDFVSVENTPTAYYPFIQMLPQATGIFIARNLNLNIILQVVFGRIGNLVFFIFFGYFSIKLIPNKKYLLMTLLLCPKVMYISTSLSGDVFTNCMAIFLISYILNLIYTCRHLNVVDYIIIGMVSCCVAVSKIVYLPLCALIFIIPKECFYSKKFSNILKKRIVVLIIFLCSVVIGVIWLKISSGFLTSASPSSELQVKYILNHPILYFVTVLRTVSIEFNNWSLDMVGGFMQWGQMFTLYPIISISVYFIFFMSLLVEENDVKLSKSSKLLIFLIFFITFILILTALYVQWTAKAGEIGGNLITGIQGRYFTPIFLLIPIILPSLVTSTDKKINRNVILYSIILLQIPTLLSIVVNNIN